MDVPVVSLRRLTIEGELHFGTKSIVRQLFGDPPFAYGPDFLWAGRPPFRSVNMASVRDATMGFL